MNRENRNTKKEDREKVYVMEKNKRFSAQANPIPINPPANAYIFL
jgi:hypothetical protein